MKKLLAVLAACFCVGSAQALEPDAELAAALALHTLDWSQTQWVGQHCDRYHETNPLMGRCPSRAHITKYFIGTAALMTAAHTLLPDKYAKWSTRIWIAVEVGATVNNAAIGVRLDY